MYTPNKDGKDIGDDFRKFMDEQPTAGGLPPVKALGEGAGSIQTGSEAGGEGNSQTPGDRSGSQLPGAGLNPDAGRTPPSPEAHNGPLMSPPTQTSPNPVAGGPAQPVTPLPAPSPDDLTHAHQFDMLGGGSQMGAAGGLLGGGLGAPNQLGSTEGADAILPLLIKLLSNGQ